jgi:hypothetical protein
MWALKLLILNGIPSINQRLISWFHANFHLLHDKMCGPGSSVGRVTDYGSNPGWGEIFRTHPDQPWGPPSLLYNGYQVFPRGKATGAWCWPPTPFNAEVEKEQSYTSTHRLGHFRPVRGQLYLLHDKMGYKGKKSGKSSKHTVSHLIHVILFSSIPNFFFQK